MQIDMKGSKSERMGIGLLAGIGYKIMPQFGIRGEIEFMYRIPTKLHFESKRKDVDGNISDKSCMESQENTLLANMYLDYYIIPAVNIYASVGVGVACIDTEHDLEPGDIPDPASIKLNFAGKTNFV